MKADRNTEESFCVEIPSHLVKLMITVCFINVADHMLASWLEYMDLNFSDKVEASFNSSCHECWCKLTNLLQEHFNICLSKVLLLVPLDVLPTPAVQKLSDQVAP